MSDEEDFTELVCNLLYQISEGELGVEEEDINARTDANQQAVLTGLLMLHEELGFQADQRAEAEVQLRRRQERQAALFDLAKVAIWDCDVTAALAEIQALGNEAAKRIGEDDELVRKLSSALTINAVNGEGLRMLGIETVPALVARQPELVNHDSLPIFRDLWMALANGERRVEIQGLLPAFNGTTLHVVVGVTVPSLDEGFTILTIADISAHQHRLAAERHAEEKTEELTRINAEVERLFYAVSHDLRAPLRGVQNLAEWAVEDMEAGDTEMVSDHMNKLRGRIERLERMMNDLLDYARVGRVERAVENVDVGALVSELPTLVNAPDGFNVVAEGDLPQLTTVRTLFTQVLLNLVGNAIKHHDKKEGRVSVAAVGTTEEDMVEFHVSDDGPGIPIAFRERVFGLFSTLQSRDAVEGSGMGLAFVQKVVRSVGGRVAIVGPDGRGTTFSITWPRVMEGAANKGDVTRGGGGDGSDGSDGGTDADTRESTAPPAT